MKHLLLTLLTVFFLSASTQAQDTVRTCLPLPPFIGSGNFSMGALCPNSTGFETIIGTLNGDSLISAFGFLTTTGGSVLGMEGPMFVYCDGVVDGTADTTIYFIGSAMPQICVISSDTDNHAVIYIDSGTLIGNHSIELQRQATTVTWNTVATFSPQDTLIVKDFTSNTAIQSYHYRLLADAECVGYNHATIHLQSNGNNLIWNQYSGGLFQLRGYYIYKRNGGSAFVLIDSTASLSYTDLNYQSGDEYYVEAFKDDGCQSNSWRSGSSAISVKSNKLKITSSGIVELAKTNPGYYIESSFLFINLKELKDVSLYDVVGRQIASERSNRLNVSLPPGFYVLVIGNQSYKVLMR